MRITYRPAQAEDCFRLAELKYVASAGMLDFLFHDPASPFSVIERVARFLAQGRGPYSMTSALVADHAGRAVGVCSAFPARLRGDDTARDEYIPAERLRLLSGMYEVTVDGGLFVDVLCVHEAYRGRGIGAELLARTKARTEREGFPCLSLLAWADNGPGLRFYARHGFREVRRVHVPPHPLLRHPGDLALLRWDRNVPAG